MKNILVGVNIIRHNSCSTFSHFKKWNRFSHSLSLPKTSAVPHGGCLPVIQNLSEIEIHFTLTEKKHWSSVCVCVCKRMMPRCSSFGVAQLSSKLKWNGGRPPFYRKCSWQQDFHLEPLWANKCFTYTHINHVTTRIMNKYLCISIQ